ncbi:MAG: hypothetical protein ACHQPI_06830 [Thermoanaerobaculia bacterium]
MTGIASRISTTRCPATLGLTDGSTVRGVLFLHPDPTRPDGVMTVLKLLEGPRDFIAFELDAGQSLLVSRLSVRTIELDATAPGADAESDPSASLDVVTLHLDSGQEISGVLRAVAEEGFQRMSDVFNAAGRFIPILVGSRLVLVARSRIVKVTF